MYLDWYVLCVNKIESNSSASGSPITKRKRTQKKRKEIAVKRGREKKSH